MLKIDLYEEFMPKGKVPNFKAYKVAQDGLNHMLAGFGIINRLQNFNKSGNFWWQLKVHQMMHKEQRKIVRTSSMTTILAHRRPIVKETQ